MHPILVKALFFSIPLIAVTLAEVTAATVPEITGYGALGAICVWLMWRDEKRSGKQDKQMEKITAATDKVAHKLTGLSRALTLSAATHGSPEIQFIARKDLERMQQSDEEDAAQKS